MKVRSSIVLITLLGAALAQAQTREGGRPHEDRPVYMVTLGDSIMWGQGLPESNKFRNIVEQWIQKQYQGTRTVIQIPTHAHSGARILADLPEQPGMTGEIPRQWPSVLKQVDLTVADLPRFGATANQVDLVLVDGGANDVDFNHIVNPFEHIGNLHNLIEDACVGRMRTFLLPKVRQAFPKAAIIVTGYFPDASSESDMTALLAFSSAMVSGAPMFAANSILSTAETLGAGINAAIVGFTTGPVLKDRMVQLSNEWNNTAQAGLSDDVKQLIQNDPQHNTMVVPGSNGASRSIPLVALAWPRFSNRNTYAAPDTYLWTVGQFVLDEARAVTAKHTEDQTTPKGVAFTRAQACIAAGEATKGLCMDASMGHPNIAGAQAYAYSILDLLQTYPEWVGLRQLNVTVTPDSVRPNVLTSVAVRASDLLTGQPVLNAVVNFENRLIPAGQTFQHLFTCTPRRPNSRPAPNALIESPEIPPPTLTVNAPGYLPVSVEFTIAGISSGSEMCR